MIHLLETNQRGRGGPEYSSWRGQGPGFSEAGGVQSVAAFCHPYRPMGQPFQSPGAAPLCPSGWALEPRGSPGLALRKLTEQTGTLRGVRAGATKRGPEGLLEEGALS